MEVTGQFHALLLHNWRRNPLCIYAQLSLVKAVAGCVYNSNFLHLSLLSGIHTMNHNLYGTAINVDFCQLMLC